MTKFVAGEVVRTRVKEGIFDGINPETLVTVESIIPHETIYRIAWFDENSLRHLNLYECDLVKVDEG